MSFLKRNYIPSAITKHNYVIYVFPYILWKFAVRGFSVWFYGKYLCAKQNENISISRPRMIYYLVEELLDDGEAGLVPGHDHQLHASQRGVTRPLLRRTVTAKSNSIICGFSVLKKCGFSLPDWKLILYF